jgi:hypothetical protein
MIDIESTVVAVLRADADVAVSGDGLHERALARARRIRTRRRLAGVTAGTGLAVVMIAGVVAVNGLVRGGSATPPVVPVGTPASSAPPAPPREQPTTLPRAVGAPVAADAPAAVGADPGVLHFDVDLAGLDASRSRWTAGRGYEGVELTHGPTTRAWIEIFLSPDPARRDQFADGSRWFSSDRKPHTDPPVPTTVAGRPAALLRYGWSAQDDPMGWILRWSPVDGLHAHVLVFEDEPQGALAAAAALRLDAAQRCVVPLRLSTAPADATLTACVTALRREPIPTRGVWMNSLLTYTTTSGGAVEVWADEKLSRGVDGSFVPNLTVAGRPAQWRSADPVGLALRDVGPAGELFISGTPRAEAVRIAAGITVAGDPADPHTWPAVPVG